MVTKASKAKSENKSKTTKKTGLSKIKRRVPEDKRFVLSNGQVIGSLKELALSVDEMGDEVFSYHVSEDRNDFSSWVKEVLKEKDLAEELMKTKQRTDFQIKLLKFIVKKL
ncbi:MAG: hypothetical protein ACQESF_01415 [Nanobdellota archaeon]